MGIFKISATFFKFLTVGLTVFHLHKLPVETLASFSNALIEISVSLAILQILS